MKRHIRSTLAGRLDSMAECGVGRLVGTSATVGAVVCAANDVPRAERDGADRLRASRDQVSAVLETVASATIAERTKIVGVGRRRADVIVAGVAVIEAIMEALSLQSLHYSTAGVRDGIVAELAGENAAIVRRRRAERWLAFA
jgi:exopolyphosphatase/guanosine-5'-triphosphate,3'-diphosphate pyrophosphatase